MLRLKTNFNLLFLPLKKFFSGGTFIFLILGLALVLRLVGINQSLWLDEAISFEAAAKYSLRELFTKFLVRDFNPPLYYLFLHFWLKFFPASEFFLRLPSVVFGVLTCFFAYKIYFLVFKEKKEALLALVLMATSPLHIYYSQEARAYSLTTFLVCGSVYYFFKFLQSKKKYFFVLIPYLLFTISMFFSHYLSLLILPVEWLYFLWQKDKNIKLTVYFLVSQFLNLVSYSVWMPVFIKQLKVGESVETGSAWSRVLGETNFKNIALIPVKFIIGRTTFDNKFLYAFLTITLVLFFGFLIFIALVCPFRQDPPAGGGPATEKDREKKEKGGEWLLGFWLGIPIILGVLISFKIPLLTYFRFLFCLPAFYLLTARGVGFFKNRKTIVILLLLINSFFSLRYLFNQNFHREDWKKVAEVLYQKNINNAPVLIFENASAPFSFYDQQKSNRIFIFQKEAIVDFDAVWLIPYGQPIFDPNNETRKWLENQGFIRTFEQHFRGVTLEKWQKLLAGNRSAIMGL